MTKEQMDSEIGRIMGIKHGEIMNTTLRTIVDVGWRVLIEIKPTQKQLTELKKLVLEMNNN